MKNRGMAAVYMGVPFTGSKTATPFPQRWGGCEKGVPSSGEKTGAARSQLLSGAGGAGFRRMARDPCPARPCVTV
jgi:hypothetical protein